MRQLRDRLKPLPLPAHSIGLFLAALVASAWLCSCSSRPAPALPTTAIKTLTNGIRVAVVHFPGSTNAALFTFLPLGLTGDGPRQTQWVHLLEHLVIRSTAPATATFANAETLPDHMRLDYYGQTNTWQEGLSHHRRWLEGVAFQEAILAAEKPKVLAECDWTAKNAATHKFAVAAWSQGLRHQRRQVSVKGDIEKATLMALQEYRNKHLVVLGQTLVCLVGGVEPDAAFPILEKELVSVETQAQPVEEVDYADRDMELTWDLDARHLLLTWPFPGWHHQDYPALLAAAQWLAMRFASDPTLKEVTGMTLAGADLSTPEERYVYVSASLRPGVRFEAVQTILESHLAVLRENPAELEQIPNVSRQLASALTQLPDVATLRTQNPNVPPATLEGNLGLQWAMQFYRHGPRLAALAEALQSLTAADVQKAAQRHLSEPRTDRCTLRPAPAQP